ncbi:hypothetical protein LTR86_006479 [Recurvomyces mirabilis]|nr:hypothetical protein LTR86_006479 [Recurvomyces mirabilis]
MEARVTKRDKKVHLSYELRHRTHSAQLYPLCTPNDSTLIVCPYDRGIRLIWRGGRRRKEVKTQGPNGQQRQPEIIILDDDEEEQQARAQPDLDAFERTDEETDPDCPYPSMTQHVDVVLDSEVLHLAVPLLPTASIRPSDALRKHAAIAVSCDDGSQRVLTFDLLPPSNDDKDDYANDIRDRQIHFPSAGAECTALAAKMVLTQGHSDSHATSFLLVSTASDLLQIYRFAVFDSLTNLQQDAELQTAQLPHQAKSVQFHPSATSTQLLLTDHSGVVRVYDPFTTSDSANTATSAPIEDEAQMGEQGKWITAFTSSFASQAGKPPRRKQVLAAQWIRSGRAILALLDDGEWGIWEVYGNIPAGKSANDFVVRGYLGASTAAEPSSSGRQSKNAAKLAPMTPNTRKVKSENFFSGATKAPTMGQAKGGISVSTSSVRAGQTDESVVMWYNSDIYCIPSLQQFWQRSTSTSSNHNFGSLYAPGLTHITDVNLFNECITSISQFAANAANSGVGHMNTQRDLLIATEYRLSILQSLRPADTPARQLFQPQGGLADAPAVLDQDMLDAGQLDVGGLDRMLDSMANGDARPRRVGFAR